MKGRIKNCIARHFEDVGRNSLLLFLSVFYLIIGIVVLGNYDIFPALKMKRIEDLIAWYQILSSIVSIVSFIFIMSRFSNFLRALAYWTIAAVGFSGGVIFVYAGNSGIAIMSFFATALLLITSKISYKKYVAMKRG